MKLHKVKTNVSLVEKAYDVIKKAIIRMEIDPGEALPEELLVEQLGISRTPIRSALLKLSHEGLVNIYPGKGTYVARITHKDMVDMLVVREALERLAASLAAVHGQEEEMISMEGLLLKQEEALNQHRDAYYFLEYDNQFHEEIARMSRNRILEKQIAGLKDRFNRFVILSRSLEKRTHDVVREHREILQAIRACDPEEASRKMAEHMKRVKMGIEDGLVDLDREGVDS